MSDFLYYTADEGICQDILCEVDTKFKPRKIQNEMLTACYSRLGWSNRAARCSQCGTLLDFQPVQNAEPPRDPASLGAGHGGSETERQQKYKLTNANFCRDRLCPMCSWRRSYKIFGQVSKIMNYVKTEYGTKYDFIFVTLTVPNCAPSDLDKTIDKLLSSFHKLINYKRVKRAIKGFFRALEVTRNNDPSSKSFNTYHPHIHVVFAVLRSYFNDCSFIKRDDWLSMWQKATKDPTITQVDVRKAGKKRKEGQTAADALAAAVAEIAKYAVKGSDFLGKMDKDGNVIVPLPEELQDDIVKTLAPALAYRRLCAFGGLFEDVRKILNLDDPEDGDLVHTDDKLNADITSMIYRFSWSCGAYKLIQVVPKSSMNRKDVIVECEDE